MTIWSYRAVIDASTTYDSTYCFVNVELVIKSEFLITAVTKGAGEAGAHKSPEHAKPRSAGVTRAAVCAIDDAKLHNRKDREENSLPLSSQRTGSRLQ